MDPRNIFASKKLHEQAVATLDVWNRVQNGSIIKWKAATGEVFVAIVTDFKSPTYYIGITDCKIDPHRVKPTWIPVSANVSRQIYIERIQAIKIDDQWIEIPRSQVCV